MKAIFRHLHGPNRWTNYAALMTEFRETPTLSLPAETIQKCWNKIEKRGLKGLATSPPNNELNIIESIAIIATNLQHPNDPENAKSLIQSRSNQEKPLIFIDCIDPQASQLAMKTAINISDAIFQGDKDLALLAEPLHKARNKLKAYLPQNKVITALIREARLLNIPFTSVAAGSNVWLFGQGAKGVHYHNAATDNDSLTGALLERNKSVANQLVAKLGFPAMIHSIAVNAKHAVSIAKEIGYPVVTKPLDRGMGIGVTAFLINESEVIEGYAEAALYSRNGVLVEKFIHGEDHRIAVMGGKVAWVAARRPSCVTGDGIHTITDLIDIENARRKIDPAAIANKIKQINVDESLILHLKKQDLTLASCPPKGTKITLSSICNLERGGLLEDRTNSLHPDNKDMAESLARAFRIDSFGIDFQTPDISKSWKDIPCGVIEVNATPGIYYDSRAQHVLRARFPGDSNGRIPSLLLISPPKGLRSALTSALTEQDLCVGETNANQTTLNGKPRFTTNQTLLARINALISDPACQAIVIETTAADIARNGLQLDHFDLAVAWENIPDDIEHLLYSCCQRLIKDNHSESAQTLLSAFISTKAPVDHASKHEEKK